MFPTASAMIEDLVYVSVNQKDKRCFSQYQPQAKEQPDEFWLIHGIKGTVNAQITVIEEPVEGFFVIKAAKKELEHLALQQKAVRYFSILEFENQFEIMKIQVSRLLFTSKVLYYQYSMWLYTLSTKLFT